MLLQLATRALFSVALITAVASPFLFAQRALFLQFCSNSTPAWCLARFPLLYSHVQREYWCEDPSSERVVRPDSRLLPPGTSASSATGRSPSCPTFSSPLPSISSSSTPPCAISRRPSLPCSSPSGHHHQPPPSSTGRRSFHTCSTRQPSPRSSSSTHTSRSPSGSRRRCPSSHGRVPSCFSQAAGRFGSARRSSDGRSYGAWFRRSAGRCFSRRREDLCDGYSLPRVSLIKGRAT